MNVDDDYDNYDPFGHIDHDGNDGGSKEVAAAVSATVVMSLAGNRLHGDKTRCRY